MNDDKPHATGSTRSHTMALTTVAMLAFSANSILGRLALGGGAADPASFTALRLSSGALSLWALLSVRRGPSRLGGNWLSAAWLFLYALPFSLAYVSIATGTGALILFGAVQSTMLLAAIVSGERPSPGQWLGLAMAMGGLVYMVLPGVSAPPIVGSALMAVAGVAWGLYSLRGRGSTQPLADTAGNFARSVPLMALAALPLSAQLSLTPKGAMLAIASGALASGCGYAVWYAALRGLTATLASTVQLSVPVLAAIGGVVFLGEAVGVRLVVATLLILGGVSIAVWWPARTRRR